MFESWAQNGGDKHLLKVKKVLGWQSDSSGRAHCLPRISSALMLLTSFGKRLGSGPTWQLLSLSSGGGGKKVRIDWSFLFGIMGTGEGDKKRMQFLLIKLEVGEIRHFPKRTLRFFSLLHLAACRFPNQTVSPCIGSSES